MNSSRVKRGVGPQVRADRLPGRRWLALLVGLCLVAGLQVATQAFAQLYGYDPVLGGHWGRVYAPWSILMWARQWYGVESEAFRGPAGAGLMVAAFGLLGVSLARVMASNSSRALEHLHGSARWANKRDLQAAGLLPSRRAWWKTPSEKSRREATGVYVGAWQDAAGRLHYLRHRGPEHVLTYAPTRSGKGVGLVVPTLLSWSDSCVVTDLKGELWALSAGWRKQHAGNRVLRFEPASATGGVCWNPLDEMRLGTEYEVGDVQNLATLLVDPDGKGLDSHWQKTAFALLVGVILHAMYRAKADGETASLPGVDAMLSSPERAVGDLWMEMASFAHVDGRNHPVVGAAARDMLDRPAEEAGSVLSTAKSYLALYRDPVVARSVSRSDLRIRQLMHEEHPVSLYIVTQANDKARLRPLVRILVTMIVRMLADRMDFEQGRPVARYKHRLLLMLDEFPSLGKLEILQESLAFVAAYGIKCYLICQDINQLKSRETGYGHDETITSNCHVQNAYPPNRVETAEHLSRLTGQTTVVKEQVTTSGRRSSPLLGQVSRTLQEVQRPLLTVDECLRMPGARKNEHGEIDQGGDMVIYVAGCPAIYGRQALYFQDPVFQARASIPAPSFSDRLPGAVADPARRAEIGS